jgi:hypothetical protein
VEIAAASYTIFQAPDEEPHPEEIEFEEDILPSELKPVSSVSGRNDNRHDASYTIQRSPEDYEKQIGDLQAALANASKAITQGGESAWYETLPTLTVQEREIIRSIVTSKAKRMDVLKINMMLGKKYGLTENQQIQIIRSAFTKWRVFLEDLFHGEYDKVV